MRHISKPKEGLIMDLENIRMSAFDTEFLQMLNQEIYKKGFDKGYDVGFTVALCSVMAVTEKGKNLVEVMKYIEDFLNGPLADKDAKARCEELIEARGEVDCNEPR